LRNWIKPMNHGSKAVYTRDRAAFVHCSSYHATIVTMKTLLQSNIKYVG